jgi:hypothetical protein
VLSTANSSLSFFTISEFGYLIFVSIISSTSFSSFTSSTSLTGSALVTRASTYATVSSLTVTSLAGAGISSPANDMISFNMLIVFESFFFVRLSINDLAAPFFFDGFLPLPLPFLTVVKAVGALSSYTVCTGVVVVTSATAVAAAAAVASAVVF